MLVQFSVANYLSFRERQTLSLVASNDDHLEQNTFAVPGTNMRLLKSAAIYGANASGKSNLLKALKFMDGAVQLSAKRQERDPFPVTPFKLDPALVDEPSEFEVVFVHDGQRYAYGFTADRERVHEEWLIAARIGSRVKARQLFRRMKDGSVKFGRSWRGDRAELVARTRPNALLLSVAAQFNNPTARPVMIWFSDKLRAISDEPERRSEMQYTLELADRQEGFVAELMEVMRAADLGIEGVAVESIPLGELEVWHVIDDATKEDILKRTGAEVGMPVRAAKTTHRRVDGTDTVFDLMTEESGGTTRLFSMAGPWLTAVRDSLVLAVDELERELHPLMTRFLVESTHAAKTTPQLIFATHDSTLLDPKLLRRDQVWFTEKDKDGATQLYSLWDFRPRKDENLQRGYLQGRYGAVPYIGEWSFSDAEA